MIELKHRQGIKISYGTRFMKTPEEWNKKFCEVINECRWETEDRYSERMNQHCETTYAYDIREERLEIIKQIQQDALNSVANCIVDSGNPMVAKENILKLIPSYSTTVVV